MAPPVGLIIFLVLAGIIILPLLWLVGKGEIERDPEVQANHYNSQFDDDGDVY